MHSSVPVRSSHIPKNSLETLTQKTSIERKHSQLLQTNFQSSINSVSFHRIIVTCHLDTQDSIFSSLQKSPQNCFPDLHSALRTHSAITPNNHFSDSSVFCQDKAPDTVGYLPQDIRNSNASNDTTHTLPQSITKQGPCKPNQYLSPAGLRQREEDPSLSLGNDDTKLSSNFGTTDRIQLQESSYQHVDSFSCNQSERSYISEQQKSIFSRGRLDEGSETAQLPDTSEFRSSSQNPMFKSLLIGPDQNNQASASVVLTKCIFKREFSCMVQERLYRYICSKNSHNATAVCSQEFIARFQTSSVLIQKNQKYSLIKPSTPPPLHRDGHSSKLLLRFFDDISKLSIGSPFLEEITLTRGDNVSSLINGWIKGQNPSFNLVYTFDFLMNHLSMLACMFYFWFNVQEPTSPMVSRVEAGLMERKRHRTHSNILQILHEYLQNRSRQLICNYLCVDVLSAFYDYIGAQEEKYAIDIHRLIEQGKRSLSQMLRIENTILSHLLLESVRSEADSMQTIYKLFEQKDKLLRDKLSDLVDLFYEVDKQRIMRNPLSTYFFLKDKPKSLSQGDRHTILACWFLGIVLRKCRVNAYHAIEYTFRFYQLARELYSRHDHHGSVFFIGLVMNIRDYLPTLYKHAQNSKKLNLCEKLAKIYAQITKCKIISSSSNRTASYPVIFQISRVYSHIENLKTRFFYRLSSIRFHQSVGALSEKISKCRKMLEQEFLESVKPVFRPNPVQKFLSEYIYEILDGKSTASANDRYEHFKTEAAKADKELFFPLLFFI